MAITSAEIHNQSFSIDRKGYDVDEVDVFLDRVADEIDGLNGHLAQMEKQLKEAQSGAFAASKKAPKTHEVDAGLLAEKDARIADLERQLEDKKADDNAISQALIIAQRSADEVLANANATAASTIKDAEEEAQRILDRAEADKQKVLDAIKKLEDDRENSREDYKELLTDFIADAARKLAEIGGDMPEDINTLPSYLQTDFTDMGASGGVSKRIASRDLVGDYVTPQPIGGAVPAALTPHPTGVEKDFSGFGDADDDFEFEDVD